MRDQNKLTIDNMVCPHVSNKEVIIHDDKIATISVTNYEVVNYKEKSIIPKGYGIFVNAKKKGMNDKFFPFKFCPWCGEEVEQIDNVENT